MYSGGTHPDGGARILAVRLGAMGDIIHTLPAVASLKHSFPSAQITWAVERRWMPLVEGNPFVHRILPVERRGALAIFANCRELWRHPFDLAVDFQGLIKSALVCTFARADRIFGYHQSQVRERAAALFYSNKCSSESVHIVDRHLDLAGCAGAGTRVRTFPLPPGRSEGTLPERPFVLASPLAGWRSKQWPMEHYAELARLLEEELAMPLVLNGPPGGPSEIDHISGIAGLIDATRRAAAVVGVDSGPLHIAAALAKPGVAIFGPTSPERNGPYGGSLTVLRSPGSATTYKRGQEIDPRMRSIRPEMVFEALKSQLTREKRICGAVS